jgi:hypothetical protein
MRKIIARLRVTKLLDSLHSWHRALLLTHTVHNSIRGSGRDITVQVGSSAEARRTVMEMTSGAVVTGVHRVRGPAEKGERF